MSLSISIRAGHQDDEGFIYTSWLKSYRTSPFGQHVEAHIFTPAHRLLIDSILPRAHILVACDAADPRTIYGFAVVEDGCLHYLFTKREFRRLGVARQLVSELLPLPQGFQFSHWTKDWEAFRHPEMPELVYNPYRALRVQGEFP